MISEPPGAGDGLDALYDSLTSQAAIGATYTGGSLGARPGQ
jgi:hypothetical protein